MRPPFKLIGYIVALVSLVLLAALAVLLFGRMNETVEASGVVEPARSVAVKPQIDGIVETVLVREGDLVKAGDTLAVLASDELTLEAEKATQALSGAQAALAQLNEEYHSLVKSKAFETTSEFANLYQAKRTEETAKEKFERAQALFTNNLISAEEMKDVQLGYEVAQANRKALEERADMLERRYALQIGEREKEVELAKREYALALARLARRVVVAPAAGGVLTPKTEELIGEKVLEGKAFLSIGDLSQMKFVAAVDEADVPKIKEGQEAKIFVRAFPHRKYKAFLGNVVNVSTAPKLMGGGIVFETTIAMTDPWVDAGSARLALKPGLSGTAKIVIRHRVRLLRVLFGMRD